MAPWLRPTRRWLFALALPLLLVLSACDASQHLTVNSDGSATVGSTLLIDNSLLTTNGQNLDAALATLQSDSQKSNPKAKVSIVKGASESGITVTQNYSSVQAALNGLTQQPAASSGQPGGMFKTIEYNNLNGTDHFTFNYSPPSSSSQSGSIPTSSLYTVHFSLTLPTKIAKASPTPTYSDDGRTATWSVPLDKPETITADGTPPTNPLVYVLVAIAVIAAIVAGFFYWRRRTPPPDYTAMAPASPAPAPPVAEEPTSVPPASEEAPTSPPQP